jgi:hypothetical protein
LNLPRLFHKTIGKRRLAVVDMRYYAKVSNVCFFGSCHKIKKILFLLAQGSEFSPFVGEKNTIN